HRSHPWPRRARWATASPLLGILAAWYPGREPRGAAMPDDDLPEDWDAIDSRNSFLAYVALCRAELLAARTLPPHSMFAAPSLRRPDPNVISPIRGSANRWPPQRPFRDTQISS